MSRKKSQRESERESSLEKFVNGTDIVSDSDLRKFFRCRYQYFITKHIAPRKIPKSVLAGAVMFFEQKRKKLYELRPGFRSPFDKNRRGGPYLRRVEDMDEDELREHLLFSSPQSFKSNSMTIWQHILSSDSYMKSRLSWGWEGHGNTMMQLGGALEFYYQKVLELGAPIMGFINKRVYIDFEGQEFSVKLPEVRRGMYLDDPTIWSFNATMPDLEGTDLHASSLVTLRLLAYCTMVSQGSQHPEIWQSRHMAHKLGVPEEIADRWQKDLIGPEATYRHWHCSSTKYGGQVVTPTTRKPEDLDNLRHALDVFNNAIEKEDFPPNHKQCDSCPYNTLDTEGVIACRKVKKGKKPTVPKYYFGKRNFEVEKDISEGKIFLHGTVRKNTRVAKKVNEYEFLLARKDGVLVAESVYESNVYGMGFEDKMLQTADKVLQEEAERRGVPIRHNVHFSKFFDHDGKKGLRTLVYRLGYRHGIKTYYPKEYVQRGEDGDGPQKSLF